MWLHFMAEDVEVSIRLDTIKAIECCGDTLTLLTDSGEKTYEFVVGVRWIDRPEITWPDLLVKETYSRPAANSKGGAA